MEYSEREREREKKGRRRKNTRTSNNREKKKKKKTKNVTVYHMWRRELDEFVRAVKTSKRQRMETTLIKGMSSLKLCSSIKSSSNVMRRVFFLLLLLGVVAFGGGGGGGEKKKKSFFVFGTAEALRRYSPIEDRNIREASGLVKSKLNSDVKTHKHAIFWTHNDSGDRARVFAIRVGGGAPGSSNVVEETADVSVVAEVTILNAGARDWEDLALWQDRDDGMKQKLCAGDIGSYRGEVVIYCFPEPKLSSNYKNVSFTKKEYLKVSYTEKIRLRYPSNEKHDAETLLVDPHTAQFLIVTKKNNNKGGLYVSEPIRSLSRSTSNALKFIRKIKLYGTSSGATGGDISWSGKKIVLKSYGRYVYEYTRQSFFDPNRDPNVRGLGEWDPSEALALDNDVPDENEIWTLNEGSRSSLKRYRLR